MTTQHWLWGGAGAALIFAVVAGIADSRRNRRFTLDNPGWVPWRGLQAAALFAALALGILGWKIG